MALAANVRIKSILTHSAPPPHILAKLEAESVNKSQKKFFLATILLKSKQKTSALASKMGQIKKMKAAQCTNLGVFNILKCLFRG